MEFYLLAFAPSKIQTTLKSIFSNYSVPMTGRLAQLVLEKIISSVWPERFHFVLLTQLLCRNLDKKNTKIPTLAMTSIMKTCGISKTGFKILSLTGLTLPYSSWRSEVTKMLADQRAFQRYSHLSYLNSRVDFVNFEFVLIILSQQKINIF